MTVLSKPVSYQWFHPLPYTCYETVHTWEPSCIKANAFVCVTTFKKALMLYSTLYFVSTILKCTNRKNWNRKTLIKYLQDTSQSTIFLTINGGCFVLFVCILTKLFKNFYGEFPFMVGFLSAAAGIGFERKKRKNVLAIYLLNLAMETAYRMARSRNMVTPVKNFQVYLFAVSNAVVLGLYRTEKRLSGTMSSNLNYLLGENEQIPLQSFKFLQVFKNGRNYFSNFLHVDLLKKLVSFLNFKHTLCSHVDGCLVNAVKGGIRNFSVGYAIQLLLNLRTIFQWMSGARLDLTNRRILTDFDLAKFMGSYLFIFRLCECLLRIIRNKNEPQINGFIAGLFSGFSSIFYKSSTISLYLFIKASQMLCNKGIEAGYLPYIRHIESFIYSISFGVLTHALYMEPHNIRPGYWRFLCNVTEGKLLGVFRKILDPFGTNASKMFPHFVPNLNPNHVKSSLALEILQNGKK